jgi:hypothetical protein
MRFLTYHSDVRFMMDAAKAANRRLQDFIAQKK